MNDCTGPRYPAEWQQLAALPQWHGKFGHLNIAVRDHDSHVTGYGKHNRVVAFDPRGAELYCRVDRVWNLPEPSIAEILAVSRKVSGTRGRWVLDRLEPNGETSTDYYFRPAGTVGGAL